MSTLITILGWTLLAVLVLIALGLIGLWVLRDVDDRIDDPLVADHLRTLRVHRLDLVDGCPRGEAAGLAPVIDIRDASARPTPVYDDVTHLVRVNAKEVPCACGKPAAHLAADPDSSDWACRVPVVDLRDQEPTVAEIAQAEQDIHDAFRINRGSDS